MAGLARGWAGLRAGRAAVGELYLHKGDLVHIVGRLKNDEWEKEGVKHRSTAIVVDEVTFMPKREPRQQGLSADFEAEIDRAARPERVEPLKPGYMKPIDPITNLPGEDEINVADIPF